MTTATADVYVLTRPDLECELVTFFDHLSLGDLTAEEVALLTAFLRPIYERNFGPESESVASENVLRLVRSTSPSAG